MYIIILVLIRIHPHQSALTVLVLLFNRLGHSEAKSNFHWLGEWMRIPCPLPLPLKLPLLATEFA